MKKILIADDNKQITTILSSYAKKEGLEPLVALDGAAAMELFQQQETEIVMVLLDVMMPKLDGWQVCREIRSNSKIPIIMLTAKDDEQDELLGFELGVDEYVSKTASMKILMARVEAILRRTVKEDSNSVLEEAGIRIDQAAHIVTIDDRPIELSVKEFELLVYFLKNKGIALSREKILNGVWNYDYYGDPRTIDTHVKKLRSKMGEKGKFIITIWAYGYKFDPES